MKIYGKYVFGASRERVFDAICDPEVLMAVIPGSGDVRRVGTNDYEGVITLRLPGAAGTYRMFVHLVDIDRPNSIGLQGRIEGAMGSLSGRADFVLAQNPAGTEIDYRGDGVIQGPLARLDSRLAEMFAQSLIGQGLKALDARLQTEVAA